MDESPSKWQRAAGCLAGSFLFKGTAALWERNEKDWYLPLNKFQKARVGIYLVLRDYARGLFPPQFPDQAKAHENERLAFSRIPGLAPGDVLRDAARKPFWNAPAADKLLADFAFLLVWMERLGIHAPARVIEIGCGPGWMSEFFAMEGYDTLGTSIAPCDLPIWEGRVNACKARGTGARLRFAVCEMENVDKLAEAQGKFDCCVVYEALHHAHDWRATVKAVANVLKPGGWFLVAAEPNVLHTVVSYRVALLTHTHEVGISRPQFIAELQGSGFDEIKLLKNKFDDHVSPHWIAARKTSKPV
ncbi:MAG TPA: class I SAM-dependent methyltransferase [Chthoniobacteraceae bacterium]|nr:class I SAM-dependent methyltransferase [Chthoniobacteraceae bacterium]